MPEDIRFLRRSNEASFDIFDCIKKIVESNDFSLQKICAYSGDNASVNYGIHNSVFTRLQKEVKHVIKANCKCHIINNCLEKGNNSLSYDIECLVLKIFSEIGSSANERIN
jgi:hypothetical protein